MAQSQQPPSIGRLVHYTNLGDRDGKYPPTVQGALITGVNDDGTVSLKVFYKTGLFDCDNIAYTDEPAGSEGARGKWCWQVFVAPKPPAPAPVAEALYSYSFQMGGGGWASARGEQPWAETCELAAPYAVVKVKRGDVVVWTGPGDEMPAEPPAG